MSTCSNGVIIVAKPHCCGLSEIGVDKMQRCNTTKVFTDVHLLLRCRCCSHSSIAEDETSADEDSDEVWSSWLLSARVWFFWNQESSVRPLKDAEEYLSEAKWSERQDWSCSSSTVVLYLDCTVGPDQVGPLGAWFSFWICDCNTPTGPDFKTPVRTCEHRVWGVVTAAGPLQNSNWPMWNPC